MVALGNGRFLLFGGMSGLRPASSIHTLSFAPSRPGSRPLTRFFKCCAQTLNAALRTDGRSAGLLDDTWLYTVRERAWRQVPKSPSPKRRGPHGAATPRGLGLRRALKNFTSDCRSRSRASLPPRATATPLPLSVARRTCSEGTGSTGAHHRTRLILCARMLRSEPDWRPDRGPPRQEAGRHLGL
jgi:hypothetical protein